MMLPSHSYRSPKIRFAEGRMVFQQLPLSSEADNFSNRLVDPSTDLLELQKAFEEGRQKHLATQKPNAPQFIDAIAENLKAKNLAEVSQRLALLAKKTESNTQLTTLRTAIENIQKRINSAPASAVNPANGPETKRDVVTTEPPKTILEKTGDALKRGVTGLGDAAEQITNTVLPSSITKEMSRGKKIAVASLMTAGVGVLLWGLFRRAKRSFGEGKNASEKVGGGFFRKWAIRLGVGAAILFGLKILADRYLPPEAVQNVGKAAVTVGGGAVEGAKQGMAEIKENYIEAFYYKKRENFKNDAEYHEYLAQELMKKGTMPLDRKNFKNDAEYVKTLEGMLEEYRKAGGNWAMVGNSIVFITKNGWDAAALLNPYTLIPAATDTVMNLDNLDKWKDAAVVYGEGFVLYASSFAVLDATFLNLALGPRGALIQTAKNTALWPVTIIRKGARTVGFIIGGQGRAKTIVESKAALKGIQYGYNRMRIREKNPFGQWTAEQVEDLFDEWRQWQNIDAELVHLGGSKSVIGYRQRTLLQKLQNGCANLIRGKGITPSFLLNAEAGELVQQIKVGEINYKNFEAVLQTLYKKSPLPTGATSSATSSASHTANPWTTATRKPSSSPSRTTGSAPHSASSGAASITSNADDIKFADNIGDALEESKLDDFLKKLGVPDELRAEVLADETASKIVKGAAQSGDIAEETRVAEMIQKGSKLRAVAIGGGMALSTLALYMAYSELVDNSDKMTKTKNPELQKIYAQTNMLVSVDAGVNVVGIVVDGIALYQTVTGTIICSAAAPIGLALLPITVGVMAVRETYRQSAHLREYFATTDRDLAKMPPHQILTHIEGSKPMEGTNALQSFIGTLGGGDAKTQQDANLNSRVNGYRGYFIQSAECLIPHPTAADVHSFRNVGYVKIADEDVKNLYKDWLSQYVIEAENDIRQRTQGEFYLVDTDVLSQVRAEAFAKWTSRRWGQKTDGKTYKGLQIESIWKQDIVAQASDPDRFIQALPAYILRKTEVVDALAFAEREIAALSFLSAYEKQMARANLLYDMRKEMQTFVSHVDKKHAISDHGLQYLVYSLKESTRGAWSKNKQSTSAPMTTMIKELVDNPTVLCAQTLEQFIAKYPLRPIYNKPQNVPPPAPSYPTTTKTENAA